MSSGQTQNLDYKPALRSGDDRNSANKSGDQILICAAECFKENGFAATSIDDVAHMLGATKGMIYHHFRSKMDLFFAVYRRGMEINFNATEPQANTNAPPLSRLACMGMAHAVALMAHQPFQRVLAQGVAMHQTGSTTAAQRDTLSELIKTRDTYEALFRKTIEETAAKLDTDIGDPSLASKSFLAVLNSTVFWYSPRRKNARAEQMMLAEELVNYALRGLGMCPPKVPLKIGKKAMSESVMDLGLSPRVEELRTKVAEMIDNEVLPLEEEFLAEVSVGDRWAYTPRMTDILEGLKAEAKKRGLWNFWLTDSERGYGLSTVEYAYLAEEMGKAHLGAETFNCSAPDTGNMEVFERYASDALKEQWLKPLLEGEIRSAYVMTEPDVASSDATNINMSCVRDGDNYVLNGEKYWISGAGDPRCKVYIVMVKTGGDDAPKHQRHSQIVVPADTPGIEILRPMHVFSMDDAPHGHMHMRFTDVRVPAENLLLGEGRGFEISQGRLGPGRIHHCMRAIGQAELALSLMCKRSIQREAFGKPLAQLGANFDIIADARMEIEQARLLCLKAAWMMDQGDPRAAAPWIHQIKVVAPLVALKITDDAMQMHGGVGISQDTPLARQWMHLRTLRFADGPDAVHRRQVARTELKKHTQQKMT